MDDSVPKPLLQDSSFTTLVHRKALNMTFFCILRQKHAGALVLTYSSNSHKRMNS